MATSWNIQNKYSLQAGLTYNAAGKTYNQINVNYGGKLTTKWSLQTKN